VTSGHKTISSYDAIPAGGSASAPGCITTKPGGPAFDRPNGSGNGIAALSHAFDTPANSGWQASASNPPSCTVGTLNPAPSVSGQIDFARSSRGPKVAGTALDYIPLFRDAVDFAFFKANGTADISTLSLTQLQTLYSNTATGTITVGADTVKACLPQSGSGTRSFFLGAIGVADAGTADVAATAAGCNGQEENGANTFATTAAACIDAVIPFSAGSFISQINPGNATDRSSTGVAAGVDLGIINPGGPGAVKPYTGVATAPPIAIDSTYYSNTTFGRDLYAVISQSKCGATCGGAGLGDPGLKSLFAGATSAVCSAAAQTTANNFGFATFTTLAGTPSTCGDVGNPPTHGGKTGALYS
jgi:hypothetical protein